MDGGEQYLERPTSVGRASAPLVEIRIVDEQDRPLPVGEVGEIQIKSCVNMRGYWNAPEATCGQPAPRRAATNMSYSRRASTGPAASTNDGNHIN